MLHKLEDMLCAIGLLFILFSAVYGVVSMFMVGFIGTGLFMFGFLCIWVAICIDSYRKFLDKNEN